MHKLDDFHFFDSNSKNNTFSNYHFRKKKFRVLFLELIYFPTN